MTLPAEYIYLDRGGERLTHVPSGDTCLRARFMVGLHSKEWIEKLSAFLARHPEARAVVNDKRAVIGQADRHPILGRPPEIGETLVRVEPYSGDPSDVATVVGIESDGDGKFLDADDSPFSYRLDDGGLLFWDGTHHGWMARGWNGGAARYREPVEGEELGDIRTPIEIKATRCIDAVASVVREHYPLWSLGSAFENQQVVRELYRDSVDLLDRVDADGRIDHPMGIRILASAVDLVERFSDLLRRTVAGSTEPTRLPRDIQQMSAMVETFVASDAFVSAHRVPEPGQTATAPSP